MIFAGGGAWGSFATTVVPTKVTCPVGGEKFSAFEIASYSSWGQRPDGRSYGTLPIYPIIECPKNGMLLVEENFSPDDVVKLTPLVGSIEYQKMRSTETPHYRGWWLLSKLDRDPYQLADFLLQASWETDADLARKARYQSSFIAAATSLKRPPEKSETWFFLNMRAANALRELGYFDKAIIVLDRIDKPELLPNEGTNIDSLKAFIAGLRTLIAEENPSPEPANLIPENQAAFRCEAGWTYLTPVEVTVCAAPALAEKRKMIRKSMEKQQKREAHKH